LRLAPLEQICQLLIQVISYHLMLIEMLQKMLLKWWFNGGLMGFNGI
jgi:hypothetical protein